MCIQTKTDSSIGHLRQKKRFDQYQDNNMHITNMSIYYQTRTDMCICFHTKTNMSQQFSDTKTDMYH